MKPAIFAKHGIPVFEVVQEPGAAVIVGPMTWHCVQSNGPTVNVATNLAPMDSRLLAVCFEHYYFDRRTRTGNVVVAMISVAIVLAARCEVNNMALDVALLLQ